MAYSDKVLDHYTNPRNVGTLDKSSKDVGTGLVGAPECGDVMRLQIKVNPETHVIEEAKFKTFGCGSAIASSSLARKTRRFLAAGAAPAGLCAGSGSIIDSTSWASISGTSGATCRTGAARRLPAATSAGRPTSSSAAPPPGPSRTRAAGGTCSSSRTRPTPSCSPPTGSRCDR